jgi:DNA topoisomerase VI subunit B
MSRRTFEVSRGLEYFTESELQMQIGAARESWPVAILKELIDNALDAVESSGAAPEINVRVTGEGFSVRDNGPGIPASTIERSLDYMVRVSDKLGYVTPTRGRLGNALKVVWAAPFVSTGEGHVTVTSMGERHEIRVGVDPLEQRPKIDHAITNGLPPGGTEILVRWPVSACSNEDAEGSDSYKTDELREGNAILMVEAFAAFNPHASFTLNGEKITSTAPDWRKWRADDRLVPHWYTSETFRELVANYIASERYGADPITVRAFVATFRGLTSTAKQKAVTEGLKREYLHDLAAGGELDSGAIDTLLVRMKDAARAPKPAALGVIGRDHLAAWMVKHGEVEPASVQYRKITGMEGELPHVVEIAFGVSKDDDAERRIVTGLNWSPTLDVPVPEIREILQEMRVDRTDPVVVLIHMARPAWNYTGRGKEAVAL